MAAQIDDLSRSLMSVVRQSAVSAAARPPVEMEEGHHAGAVQLRRGGALLHGLERARLSRKPAGGLMSPMTRSGPGWVAEPIVEQQARSPHRPRPPV